MATPKPGEIRCPTCHRSTAPAAFCTQCGSAIPPDARIRPRGMDRDELQDRIRARRSGGDPYRRGGTVDDERTYERYEPDPTDARARRSHRADERRQDLFGETAPEAPPHARPPDLTRERDDWSRPAAAPTRAAAPPPPQYAVPPSDVPVRDEPAHVDHYDDGAYADERYAYEYDDWEERRERRSGLGAVAILGFLALGVLALLGGALLAGVFTGDPGVAQEDPSPTVSASVAASVAASGPASAAPSAGASAPAASPAASGEPVIFPDGFVAEAQPCIPGSVGSDGCASNGATNAGQVEIWIGFENGNASDVIGATLISPDGTEVDGSIDLADINCQQSCNGYTYFPFTGLEPGEYGVRVTRNGELAAVTSFQVS